MSNSDQFEDDRKALASACLDAKRRVVSRPPKRPSRWHPYTVLVPELANFNITYNDQTAFEFCGQQLNAGYPIERIALDTPPGCFGYLLRFPQPDGRELYVKLELSPAKDFVFGRSFHFSDKVPGQS
jgi:hypothetical protein